MFGILAALFAAYSWTYACFLWREQTKYLSVVQINLIKNLIAFIIFSPILITINWFEDFKNIIILLFSGVIGISLGDSFYITSLKKIGTRKTLTIESLSPIIATFFGSILIGESINARLWIGTSIVTLSLFILARDRNITYEDELNKTTKPNNGFLFAILSVLCAVIAAILSRIVLINSTFSPFQTTEIRLLGSLFALYPIIRFKLKPKKLLHDIPNKIKIRIFFATILGTNLGILLQQFVFQSLPIGIGWTLLSTSPVISLFFAKNEGDKVNLLSILIAVSTLVGICIIFI